MCMKSLIVLILAKMVSTVCKVGVDALNAESYNGRTIYSDLNSNKLSRQYHVYKWFAGTKTQLVPKSPKQSDQCG